MYAFEERYWYMKVVRKNKSKLDGGPSLLGNGTDASFDERLRSASEVAA
jgi:hypothetical protein